MSQSIDLLSILLLSIGLAMDAFSVALVAGFGLGKIEKMDMVKVSITFGFAHVLMPIIGWGIGSTIIDFVQQWDHWVAFLLLAFIGGKMVKEGLDDSSDEIESSDLLTWSGLILFTVAVSIDALAVGLSFSLQNASVLVPSLVIGFGTVVFTYIGLNIGGKVGSRFGKRAQVLGGIILIIIGLNIVLKHIF